MEEFQEIIRPLTESQKKFYDAIKILLDKQSEGGDTEFKIWFDKLRIYGVFDDNAYGEILYSGYLEHFRVEDTEYVPTLWGGKPISLIGQKRFMKALASVLSEEDAINLYKRYFQG